jgi:ferrous iron transport protein B
LLNHAGGENAGEHLVNHSSGLRSDGHAGGHPDRHSSEHANEHPSIDPDGHACDCVGGHPDRHPSKSQEAKSQEANGQGRIKRIWNIWIGKGPDKRSDADRLSEAAEDYAVAAAYASANGAPKKKGCSKCENGRIPPKPKRNFNLSAAPRADIANSPHNTDRARILTPHTTHHAPSSTYGVSALDEKAYRSQNTKSPIKNIVLVGNTNVGKSTLFNLLTGANQKIVNAPGTTVSLEEGFFGVDGEVYRLVDLPGSCSMYYISPDEEVTTRAILKCKNESDIEKKLCGYVKDIMSDDVIGLKNTVIVFLSSLTHITSSLYFYAQVAELGVPVILAVTKVDIAKKNNSIADYFKLKELIGVDVVAINPRDNHGVDDLKAEIKGLFEKIDSGTFDETSAIPDGLEKIEFNVNEDDIKEVVRKNSDRHFKWVAKIENELNESKTGKPQVLYSDKIDRFLLHPVFGILSFLVAMFFVFQLTSTFATPLIDFINGPVQDLLLDKIAQFTDFTGISNTWLSSFIENGLLNGVITVLSFLPPMGIMFLLLSLLEDSGYMARTAFIADRVMRKLGLDGRSFLPLLIGFGCNLPAYAATKTLPDSSQRRLTAYLIPFTSCSARFTVYFLLAHTFFPENPGGIVFLMYILSATLILAVGLVLKRTKTFKELSAKPFVLSLPDYQVPKIKNMLKSTVIKLGQFVVDAGRIIVAVVMVIWFLQAIPAPGKSAEFANIENPHDSIFGVVSDAVSPIFTPAGFADWRISASLITGFVAKEVVVGSLSQSYINEDIEESGDDESSEVASRIKLSGALKTSFNETSGGHGMLAGFSYMLFIMTYTPCLASVAEARRQFGTRFAIQSITLGLIVAFALSIFVFQVGRLFI